MTPLLPPTPEGMLRPAWVSPDLLEFFCHPFTAGETYAQSRLGALKLDGRPARAEIVDRCGNGDYIIRCTFADPADATEASSDRPVRVLELVA